MVQIEVDGKLVTKMKVHFAGEDGELMWLEFETESGLNLQSFYFKGSI